MADKELTKPERDALLQEIDLIFKARYPDHGRYPSDREDNSLRKRCDLLMQEYAQKLPHLASINLSLLRELGSGSAGMRPDPIFF